jgi:hypothetical protein
MNRYNDYETEDPRSTAGYAALKVLEVIERGERVQPVRPPHKAPISRDSMWRPCNPVDYIDYRGR